MLQNVLGEGALSASFIPVYARLLAEGRQEEARRVAGAVAAFLGLLVALVVAVGVSAAPWLVDLLAPGYAGAKRALIVDLVRILFPGLGLLVWSAWCLGILNSHRRFFLPYAAPVLWNAAIIAATLLAPAGALPERIVVWTAWGTVLGGALQLLIQLPAAARAARPAPPGGARSDPAVRTVFRNFGPSLLTRGIVQVSAWIDTVLTSYLPTGAAAALGNAQLVYTLPISLFGVSVAAAALPTLSAEAAGPEALRARLERGIRQIAFFVVPSAVAMLGLGHVLAAALFQTGAFSAEDARYVWGILAGYSLGLLGSTFGRLFASGWFALHDTRSPLRYASARVGLTVLLGTVGALWAPGLLGLEARWGAAGITVASAAAAMMECLLLRRGLERKLGRIRLPPAHFLRLGLTALAALGVAWLVWRGVGGRVGPVLTALLVLGPFGVVYLGGTYWLRVREAGDLLARLKPGA